MDIISSEDLYYQVVGRAGTNRYCTLASMLWLTYDWLLTLGDEVELIWSRDWTLAGKPMYLFVRYGGMLFQLYDLIQMMGVWSIKFCSIYFWIRAIGTAILLYTMDLLLAYRVICLYRVNAKVLWINIVAFVFCVASSVIIIAISTPLFEIIPTPEYITGCWAIMPPYDFTALVPGLLYELWLFGLVVAKVIAHTRVHGTSRMTGLFRVLVKDSSIWFFIVAGSIAWNLIQVPLSPRGLRGVVLPAFRTIVIICGCRLVLHLRKAYFVQANDVTTQGRSTSAYDSQTRTFGSAPQKRVDIEEENARKAIKFAQKIGLPPVDFHELGSWDEEEVKQATDGGRDHEVVPHHADRRSDETSPGHKKKKLPRKRRKRDLENGLDVEVSQETGAESQDCFEMVQVRVDVESHAVVEESAGVGALTPRERRRLAAATAAGTEPSRADKMERIEEDDSTEYETSSSSSLERKESVG